LGWISYQIEPDEDYNEIILFVSKKQMSVATRNTWYSWCKFNLWCFYKYNDPKRCALFIRPFRQRPIEIDTINFSGPRFADVDNRLMSLQLVKTE
jgi:hypothetical protein